MKKKIIISIAIIIVLGVCGVSAFKIFENNQLAKAMNERYLSALELFDNVIETELLAGDFTYIKESIDKKKCDSKTEEEMTNIETTLAIDVDDSLLILDEQEKIYEEFFAQIEQTRKADAIAAQYLAYEELKDNAKYKDAYTKISELVTELGTTCEYERGNGDAVVTAENTEYSGERTVELEPLSKEELTEVLGLSEDELDEIYRVYEGNYTDTGSASEALEWAEQMLSYERESKEAIAQYNAQVSQTSSETYVDTSSSVETNDDSASQDTYTEADTVSEEVHDQEYWFELSRQIALEQGVQDELGPDVGLTEEEKAYEESVGASFNAN